MIKRNGRRSWEGIKATICGGTCVAEFFLSPFFLLWTSLTESSHHQHWNERELLDQHAVDNVIEEPITSFDTITFSLSLQLINTSSCQQSNPVCSLLVQLQWLMLRRRRYQQLSTALFDTLMVEGGSARVFMESQPSWVQQPGSFFTYRIKSYSSASMGYYMKD